MQVSNELVQNAEALRAERSAVTQLRLLDGLGVGDERLIGPLEHGIPFDRGVITSRENLAKNVFFTGLARNVKFTLGKW